MDGDLAAITDEPMNVAFAKAVGELGEDKQTSFQSELALKYEDLPAEKLILF